MKYIILIILLVLLVGCSPKTNPPIANAKKNFPTTNISNIIRINNETNIIAKRERLINYIWKGELPLNKVPIVQTGGRSNYFLDWDIHKLTVNMEHNITSSMYHFHANSPNNRLVIYHHGHNSPFYVERELIELLLNNGYDVIVISMPLEPTNNQPEIFIEGIGNFKFTSHEYLRMLDTDKFSSIKFFIEPVIQVLNYAEKEGFEEISMVGISGGGWTTILASAIDTRIKNSFHVAAPPPLYIRPYTYGLGGYEESLPELYRIANYLELYIMGAYGKERQSFQINIPSDEVINSGEYHKLYQDDVYNSIDNLGNAKFEIFVDYSTKKHTFSKDTIEFILEKLND